LFLIHINDICNWGTTDPLETRSYATCYHKIWPPYVKHLELGRGPKRFWGR